MAGAERRAQVLIDSPLPQLDRLFDYAIPAELADAVRPGVRVKVPLRTLGRVVDGYVVDVLDRGDDERPLSDIEEVVGGVEVMPDALYRLARRVADRAAGAATDILRLAIPKRQVRVERSWQAADDARTVAVDEEAARTARSLLDEYPGLDAALEQGARIALDAPAHPVDLQDNHWGGAWASLLACTAVSVFARGSSVVLVVPDYRDQDTLITALTARVGAEAIVRVDARQTAAARYRGYLRMLESAPCIVVGNRSAVYAPVRAGLVCLWDDGDALLEEPLAPYVHARDAALVRQELEGSALIFAGHTRSADVERLVAIGFVRDIAAARRYSPRVSLAAPGADERPGARIPSTAFRAVRTGLASGPVLVQVARPGYAPVLICADCRRPARCSHCAGPLFARARGTAPVCKWCGRTAHAWRCGTCDSERLRLASSGSERTADELGRAFPDTRVIIADGEHQVLTVDAEPALVIATRGAEPIAAGGYSAVLLLDGERMLLADDLRIAESCLRWWSNAAALATPGAPVLLVGVTGNVARALATWTQAAFARTELQERAPLHMPPTVRVAVLDGAPAAVAEALTVLRESVPHLAAEAILGPVRFEDDAGDRARALVRFDYALGAAVAGSLRASVVQAALKSRRKRGSQQRATTLRVRLDVADPQL